MGTRRIGIVGFEGLQALDAVGPADVFAAANILLARKAAAYEVVLMAAHTGPLITESGLLLHADTLLSRSGPLDTIIIPGGSALRTEAKVRIGLANWLCAQERSVRRLASVCTGVYALAESGLLNGRAATTHWRFASDLQERWKSIRVDPDAIFIRDEKYYTSAGITAGIDLCLALVEEDFGDQLALEVARELVVYLKRSGGQLQYSQPLRIQSGAKRQFSDVASWIREHLNEDLTVEILAERVHVSPRHLNRKFKSAFGLTPADFVEELRLDEARWQLTSAGSSIGDVAGSIGYRSDDAFRRAFERRFGVSPREYRRRFSSGKVNS